MSKRRGLQIAIVLLVGLCLGASASAAVLAFIPNPGSAPSIYDAFSWDSTANEFWHVNSNGSAALVKNGLMTLTGHNIELDRRIQTDPKETDISARVRGIHLKRFGIGIGVYHAGTVAVEFDDDGIKCGRGTDHGWQVDYLNGLAHPPSNTWIYLRIAVINPYPNPEVYQRLSQKYDSSQLKKATVICSAWDSRGHLLARVNAKDPKPNTNYTGLDEAFFRTWDSNNEYQLDWFYAGPPSNDPTHRFK